MPTRPRTATGSHPALALLCLGTASRSSRHTSNRPVGSADAENTRSDMAPFSFPRARLTASAPRWQHPIPIHPPR
jgi:hypothetical protein